MSLLRKLLPCAVDDCPKFVGAGDEVVGYSHVVGGANVAQRIARFRTNPIVPGRIDRAVGNTYVAATVDVHAVAVGIDDQVIDREVVNARGKNSEVASLQNGEVAQQDVTAVLESDGFVADAGLFSLEAGVVAVVAAISIRESFAVNQSGADDGEVTQVLAYDQRIVPMIVAIILLFLPWLRWPSGVVNPTVVAGGFTGLRRVRG